MSNKLKAKITNIARAPTYTWYGGRYIETSPNDDETDRHYGFALTRGIPTVFSNCDSILDTTLPTEDRKLYILREPNWNLTTVSLEDLRALFKSRGIAPRFFFPEGAADGFKDKNHRRYSAKLATAVSAWETVVKNGRNKSVKQTLVDWIVSNGVRFGLGNEDGVVSQSVAEEVAKIANWQTSGGATPTYTEEAETEAGHEIGTENFEEVRLDQRSAGYESYVPVSDDDGEIPF